MRHEREGGGAREIERHTPEYVNVVISTNLMCVSVVTGCFFSTWRETRRGFLAPELTKPNANSSDHRSLRGLCRQKRTPPLYFWRCLPSPFSNFVVRLVTQLRSPALCYAPTVSLWQRVSLPFTRCVRKASPVSCKYDVRCIFLLYSFACSVDRFLLRFFLPHAKHNISFHKHTLSTNLLYTHMRSTK